MIWWALTEILLCDGQGIYSQMTEFFKALAFLFHIKYSLQFMNNRLRKNLNSQIKVFVSIVFSMNFGTSCEVLLYVCWNQTYAYEMYVTKRFLTFSNNICIKNSVDEICFTFCVVYQSTSTFPSQGHCPFTEYLYIFE